MCWYIVCLLVSDRSLLSELHSCARVYGGSTTSSLFLMFKNDSYPLSLLTRGLFFSRFSLIFFFCFLAFAKHFSLLFCRPERLRVFGAALFLCVCAHHSHLLRTILFTFPSPIFFLRRISRTKCRLPDWFRKRGQWLGSWASGTGVPSKAPSADNVYLGHRIWERSQHGGLVCAI